MNSLADLVAEIAAADGVAPPEALAPTAAGEGGLAIVALVGGKNVGKTALARVLAGEGVGHESDTGAGTDTAVAYVHADRAAAARALLDPLLPSPAVIVTHTRDALREQVLLDLPDIDSHFAGHLETVRRALGATLYPLWVQSVEKYADAEPRRLLSAVARGNDPANFLFILTKCDRLWPMGDAASAEVAADYARRAAAAAGMDAPPRVWSVSAHQPTRGDLPELVIRLSRGRSAADVARDSTAAAARFTSTRLAWLADRRLPERAAAAESTAATARELLGDRLMTPLARAATAAAEDAAWRGAITDAALDRRLPHWPLLGLVHAVAAPVAAAARRFAGGAVSRVDAEPLARTHLAGAGDVAGLVQSAMAAVQQADARAARLLAPARPWEPLHAAAAAEVLARAVAAALRDQRDAALARVGQPKWLLTPFRWGVTVGAIVWFPLVQPLAAAWIEQGRSVTGLALGAVNALSWPGLLGSGVLLLVWFAVLYVAVRRDTAGRVHRLLDAAQLTEASTTAAVDEWADGLLMPLSAARDRLARLAARVSKAAAGSTIAPAPTTIPGP